MKISSLALCVCLALLSVACEEIVDDPGALPYHEKLVIRGVLEEGRSLDSISVTRTLPPLERYSDEKAIVRNALVLVRHNGQTDTLTDHGNSRYFKPGIAIHSGDIFELTVEWNGKRATAVTTIPQIPVVLSAERILPDTYEYSSGYLEATITPRSTEAYTATSLYRYPPPNQNIIMSTNYPYQVKRPTGDEPVLTIRSYSYWGDISGDEYIIVHAYDAPFYDYYTTFGQNSEELFGVSGQQVQWNVHGDGIGMFIGRARSKEYRVP